jgi:1-acyl-sn-glycerol-3-phosphate acyltransferase
MKKITILLHTFLARFLLIVIIIPLVPVVLFASCFPRNKRFSSVFLFKMVDFFYEIIVRCLFVPIAYQGQENMPKTSAIIIANHQSSLDIPLIGITLEGKPHIWLARKELMKTVALRWLLAVFAEVVDVRNTRSAAISLRRVITLAQETDAHVLLFPEGSRSVDGKLQPFFDGYFLLAKKLHRPVVPIFIHNVCNVYSRSSFFIKRVPIQVVVGKPMDINDYLTEALFKEAVSAWFYEQQKI